MNKKGNNEPARVNVLAISYAMPPALLPQAIQIGRLLSHSSHSIGVVCGFAAGNTEADKEYEARLAFRLHVPRPPGLPRLLDKVARRAVPFFGRVPDEYRSWTEAAQKAVVDRLADGSFKPDVNISFGEPMSDHLLGRRLKRQLGVPWIAHFSDPWADNPFRRHEVLANIVNRRLEAQTVEEADLLVFTSEETLVLFERRHGHAIRSNAAVLSHSYDPASYHAGRKPGGGKIMARYLGNFYGRRKPFPLLKALYILRQAADPCLENVHFEIVGDMPHWMKWHPLVRGADPSLVTIVPPVSYLRALELMTVSDLLLVIDAPAKESVFLPSKLIEYFGSDADVMGIVPPGASQRLIAQDGGRTADPADTAGVVKALRLALNEIKNGPRQRQAGRDAIRARYQIGPVVRAFDDIVGRVVKSLK